MVCFHPSPTFYVSINVESTSPVICNVNVSITYINTLSSMKRVKLTDIPYKAQALKFMQRSWKEWLSFFYSRVCIVHGGPHWLRGVDNPFPALFNLFLCYIAYDIRPHLVALGLTLATSILWEWFHTSLFWGVLILFAQVPNLNLGPSALRLRARLKLRRSGCLVNCDGPCNFSL